MDGTTKKTNSYRTSANSPHASNVRRRKIDRFDGSKFKIDTEGEVPLPREGNFPGKNILKR